ncbi:MAG TPA: hypothetical protein VFA20_11975 [Myxococcaceae bacterium]|nr:hypothetical protein [Myxococcaceae bacterium]
MSHGIHNHGHHHLNGLHAHGNHGAAAAKGASGEKKAPAGAAASTPAAQAGQAQQPDMNAAMAALDQAIKSLAANFHTDSFNGQQAPAGMQAAPSTLTNAVGPRSSDLFLNQAGAAPAQAPQAHLQSAPAPAPAAAPVPTDVLSIRGGGGLAGGVVAGGGSFLNQGGGGGLPGGVVATSKL